MANAEYEWFRDILSRAEDGKVEGPDVTELTLSIFHPDLDRVVAKVKLDPYGNIADQLADHQIMNPDCWLTVRRVTATTWQPSRK